MKKIIPIPIRCLFVLLGFLLSTGLFAQDAMFIDATGTRLGAIKGSVTEKGREGLIKVVGFSHEIVSPRDAASGQATGKRQHKPITITKEIDKSTPLLFSALCTNENLSSVNITFYRSQAGTAAAGRAGAGAVSTQYFTIQLQNAMISSIRTRTGDKGQTLEEISFTYQKIIWTYTDGGVTHEDTWITQN